MITLVNSKFLNWYLLEHDFLEHDPLEHDLLEHDLLEHDLLEHDLGGPTPNMLEFAIWGWGKMGKSVEKWGKLKTSKFMFRKNFFINYSS